MQYRLNASCEVLVQKERVEVRIDRRAQQRRVQVLEADLARGPGEGVQQPRASSTAHDDCVALAKGEVIRLRHFPDVEIRVDDVVK